MLFRAVIPLNIPVWSAERAEFVYLIWSNLPVLILIRQIEVFLWFTMVWNVAWKIISVLERMLPYIQGLIRIKTIYQSNKIPNNFYRDWLDNDMLIQIFVLIMKNMSFSQNCPKVCHPEKNVSWVYSSHMAHSKIVSAGSTCSSCVQAVSSGPNVTSRQLKHVEPAEKVWNFAINGSCIPNKYVSLCLRLYTLVYHHLSMPGD